MLFYDVFPHPRVLIRTTSNLKFSWGKKSVVFAILFLFIKRHFCVCFSSLSKSECCTIVAHVTCRRERKREGRGRERT